MTCEKCNSELKEVWSGWKDNWCGKGLTNELLHLECEDCGTAIKRPGNYEPNDYPEADELDWW